MKTVLPVLAAFCLALTGCASAPQMPGTLVDVDGRKMHLHCIGAEHASPTIVIEGGLGGVSPFYYRLQQGLKSKSRVCSYDRPGLGWSAGTDSSRDAKQVAMELHALLRSANIPPPYVLVGHSLGGLIVLRYQHDFPKDVVGLVLLDSSYPSQSWNEKSMLRTYRLAQVGAALGITHLYNPARAWFEALPEEQRTELLYFSNQSSTYKAIMGEIKGLSASSSQAAEIKSLGDLPLLVVTAGKQTCSSKATEEQQTRCAVLADNWNKRHVELASLSTRGRYITLRDANHNTLVTEQRNVDEVIEHIGRVVAEAK